MKEVAIETHRQTQNIELEGYVLRRMPSVAADHTMGE